MSCEINGAAINKRLALWKCSDIQSIYREALAIQERLRHTSYAKNEENQIKSFRHLMSIGKISSAIRILDQTNTAGILPINDETIKLLNEKHPNAQPINDDMVLQGPIKHVDKIIFEGINGALIKKIAFNMKGSAGPSGMDADQWRLILGTKIWGSYSDDLANSIARMTRILATDEI